MKFPPPKRLFITTTALLVGFFTLALPLNNSIFRFASDNIVSDPALPSSDNMIGDSETPSSFTNIGDILLALEDSLQSLPATNSPQIPYPTITQTVQSTPPHPSTSPLTANQQVQLAPPTSPEPPVQKTSVLGLPAWDIQRSSPRCLTILLDHPVNTYSVNIIRENLTFHRPPLQIGEIAPGESTYEDCQLYDTVNYAYTISIIYSDRFQPRDTKKVYLADLAYLAGHEPPAPVATPEKKYITANSERLNIYYSRHETIQALQKLRQQGTAKLVLQTRTYPNASISTADFLKNYKKPPATFSTIETKNFDSLILNRKPSELIIARADDLPFTTKKFLHLVIPQPEIAQKLTSEMFGEVLDTTNPIETITLTPEASSMFLEHNFRPFALTSSQIYTILLNEDASRKIIDIILYGSDAEAHATLSQIRGLLPETADDRNLTIDSHPQLFVTPLLAKLTLRQILLTDPNISDQLREQYLQSTELTITHPAPPEPPQIIDRTTTSTLPDHLERTPLPPRIF